MAYTRDRTSRPWVIAVRLLVALPIFACAPSANSQSGAPMTIGPGTPQPLSPPVPPLASTIAPHIPAERNGLGGRLVVPGTAIGTPCPQVLPPPNVDIAEWQRQRCLQPGPCDYCPDRQQTPRQ
jgi:hypothetical protein